MTGRASEVSDGDLCLCRYSWKSAENDSNVCQTTSLLIYPDVSKVIFKSTGEAVRRRKWKKIISNPWNWYLLDTYSLICANFVLNVLAVGVQRWRTDALVEIWNSFAIFILNLTALESELHLLHKITTISWWCYSVWWCCRKVKLFASLQLPTSCCRSRVRWSWRTSEWQVSWQTRRSRGKPLWERRSGWLLRSSSSPPTTPR